MRVKFESDSINLYQKGLICFATDPLKNNVRRHERNRFHTHDFRILDLFEMNFANIQKKSTEIQIKITEALILF